MSMLSAQVDELRAMAESVGLAVPQAATLMMEAADTIWQLRDDLQRANAENAKLRELVRILAYCMSEDRDCDRCALNGADMPTPRISACDSLPDLMRELGVEVDG